MWRFVLTLCRNVAPSDHETIGMIGVGPLYDMIRVWPETTFAAIEAEVGTNPALMQALSGGVTSTQAARRRIEAILARHGEGPV